MFNVKRFPRKNKSSEVEDCTPIDSILQAPIQSLRKHLTPLQLNITNYVLAKGARYEDIYMRQDTIAKYVGTSREWVNKSIKKIVSLGLISKHTRPNKSCVYRVSSWLSDYWVRKKLSPIFNAFKWLPLSLLIPALQSANTTLKESSHDVNKVLFIKSLTTTNSRILSNYDYKERCHNSNLKIKESGMSKLLSRLQEELKFDEETLAALATYDEKILLAAEKALAKSKKNIVHRGPYFLSICSSLAEQASKPQQSKAFVSQATNPKPYTNPDADRERNVAESWNSKSIEQLQEMRTVSLSKVSDPLLKGFMSDIFARINPTLVQSQEPPKSEGGASVTDNAPYAIKPSIISKRFDVMASKYKPFVARRPVELVITSDMANAITLLDKNEMGEFLVETMRKIEDYEVRQRWYQEAMNIWNVAKTVVLPPISEEDEWFNQQQPMDIDDYDPIQ
jgi:hypothetical protein